MVTETVVLTLEAVRCYLCGVVFGIESGHHARLKESHESFYCPNGHSQAYLGKTAKERRIEQLEQVERSLKASRDFWAEQSASANRQVAHTRRRLNGYKGVVTRLKRRAVHGRCPCCSHQFKDLKRHMAERHPDWNPDVEANHRATKQPTQDATS